MHIRLVRLSVSSNSYPRACKTSEGPQTFDVALTSLTIYGSTKPSSSLYKFYYPGRDVTTASWRTSANTRIDSIRKGDLNVKVVDSNNNVIPGV